jgi:hypothetical protein
LFDGHHSHVTNGIELALGRSARDFRDYARDKREPWAPSGKLA